MNTRSLKTIIAVNIFVLLFIAIILIDFVMVATAQKAHLTSLINSHQELVESTRKKFLVDKSFRPELFEGFQPAAGENFDKRQFPKMAAIDHQGHLLAANRDLSGPWQKKLTQYAQQAVTQEKRIIAFEGKTWGVFLPREEYLLVAGPVIKEQTSPVVSIVTAYNLGYFYAGQRRQQGIIMIYALINIIVLTILGTMAISSSAVRPIYRLVKRAEEYQEASGTNFSLYREKNEFQQLSGALNRMLQRISEDKRKLQSSLEELGEANQELKNQQNQLIKAEKLASVGRLSAGLAHEIGNPVGIVLGYLDLLSRESLSEDQKKDYLSRCNKEVNRISVVIRELLDFARPAAGEIRDPVPVHDIIHEAVSMLQVQPIARDITITYALNAENDRVAAMPERLRQVLINLVLNSMDAIATAPDNVNGHIKIDTSTELTNGNNDNRERLVITITDNGSGIAEADLDNIFDPFFTTKEPGRGTGLGLSVCYMIIHGLGGEMEVGSRVSRGTTFTLRLPLVSGGEFADKKHSGNDTHEQ